MNLCYLVPVHKLMLVTRVLWSNTGICQYSEHCDQYTVYVTKQNCNIVHMYFIIFQNVSALKNVDCRKLKSIKDTLEKKSKMSQGKCHRTYANNLQCIKQILKVASEVWIFPFILYVMLCVDIFNTVSHCFMLLYIHIHVENTIHFITNLVKVR